ncbi:MAG: hypothetical protein IJZ26_00945 [Clostridia bacterium]|nr:hypothetical protein [Clostridia bacterium]
MTKQEFISKLDDLELITLLVEEIKEIDDENIAKQKFNETSKLFIDGYKELKQYLQDNADETLNERFNNLYIVQNEINKLNEYFRSEKVWKVIKNNQTILKSGRLSLTSIIDNENNVNFEIIDDFFKIGDINYLKEDDVATCNLKIENRFLNSALSMKAVKIILDYLFSSKVNRIIFNLPTLDKVVADNYLKFLKLQDKGYEVNIKSNLNCFTFEINKKGE